MTSTLTGEITAGNPRERRAFTWEDSSEGACKSGTIKKAHGTLDVGGHRFITGSGTGAPAKGQDSDRDHPAPVPRRLGRGGQHAWRTRTLGRSMSGSWWGRVFRARPRSSGERMVKRDETPELIEARKELAKSRVRVCVTHLAAAFVFGGGAVLVLALGAGWVNAGDANVIAMKEVFMTVLPIATGVITYWFADRAASKRRPDEGSVDRDRAQDRGDT